MSEEHSRCQSELNDYVSGDLNAERSRRIENHVETCPRCRRELDGLLALSAGARALPREIAPPPGLWEKIEARIGEAPEAGSADAAAVGRSRRAPGSPWWWRAAAAVALVVLSSGGTVYWMRHSAAPPTVAAAPAGATGAQGLAAFASSEAAYEDAVGTLRAQFDARRAELAPETVVTIENNLRIIDQAIADVRRALREDPVSPELPLLLSQAYRNKVDLLRSAVQLEERT